MFRVSDAELKIYYPPVDLFALYERTPPEQLPDPLYKGQRMVHGTTLEGITSMNSPTSAVLLFSGVARDMTGELTDVVLKEGGYSRRVVQRIGRGAIGSSTTTREATWRMIRSPTGAHIDLSTEDPTVRGEFILYDSNNFAQRMSRTGI